MPLDMQVSLLRVLEERRFERIGSAKSQIADVRIVSATHRDVEVAIAAGRFREDLYYRLNVFPVVMPSLAERREDVPALVAHFAAAHGEYAPVFTPEATARLIRHDWPGNVREVRNFVERAAIRYIGRPLGVADVEASLHRPVADAIGAVLRPVVPAPAAPTSEAVPPPRHSLATMFPGLEPARLLARGGFDLRFAMGNLERSLIEAALAASDDVVADAARTLGLQRTTLVEKMRRFDVRRGGDALMAA